jgi:hypothetical protein
MVYNITSKTDLDGVTLFFDDSDSRIKYSGSWSAVPASNMTAGEEAFGHTATTSGVNGGSFTFDFDGVCRT